ncbi:MAG TPA: hypothetical protein VFZ16_06220 [Hyphomicrobiaceae bacterium]|nr:hypothetical protein [Hyphomicrobiaceae bacterium]
MGTIDDLTFILALGMGAICGAATGRAFAVEGEDRRTSILAAAYCGAGSGVLSAPLLVFVVVLVTRLLDADGDTVTALAYGGEAVGRALLWGVVGGAGGGLAIGILVALFKRYAPR